MPDPAPSPTRGSPLAFWRWKLHWQILLGLIVGSIIGYLVGAMAVSASDALKAAGTDTKAKQIVTAGWAYLLFDLIGDMFLNGLKLIVIPLVMTSIILAVAGMGGQAGFGRMGLKTLTYYMATSLIAILIGLSLINLIKPGIVPDNPATPEREKLLSPATVQEQFKAEQSDIEKKAGDRKATDFLDVFRTMIPDNPVKAAAEGNLLGLIICSLLIGYFIPKIGDIERVTLTNFLQAVYDITMKITDLVLAFAPIGVGMLVAATVSENYAALAQDNRFDQFITGVVSFAVSVFAGLLIHLVVVMPLILCLVARVNPLRHFKAMAPALMTAFSTASSNATLPVTMECIQNAGVSRRVSSFVLPLGATVNMDGTALYECAAAVFIAQAFGIELSFGQQFFVVVVALLTSIGVAGVPSASLVAIVIILESLSQQLAAQGVTGVRLEAGLPILLVFDRPLDMCRTAVNIFSDSVGTVVVAKSEGEDVLTGAPPSAATS